MAQFRVIGLLAALALAFVVGAPTLAQERITEYVLPGDQVYPEGVAYDRTSGNFYVSSTSDGTIFRGNIDQPQAEVFLPGRTDGRTAATGLKVDEFRDRLFVSGGGTGKMFVYDTNTGELLAQFASGLNPTFVNDVALTLRNGSAYFTDSQQPYLYRVYQNDRGDFAYEKFIDFTGTPLVYQQGFNVNGIAATLNGRYLVVVQSNTGKLFRIEVPTKAVTEIDLGGTTVTNGDGLVLRGRTLYVVRNSLELISRIELSGDLLRGTVISETTDDSFKYPTTAALAGGRLLVVNAQFDKRQGGNPELPFTVSSIPTP